MSSSEFTAGGVRQVLCTSNEARALRARRSQMFLGASASGAEARAPLRSSPLALRSDTDLLTVSHSTLLPTG